MTNETATCEVDAARAAYRTARLARELADRDWLRADVELEARRIGVRAAWAAANAASGVALDALDALDFAIDARDAGIAARVAAEDEGERVPHCSNCNGTVLKEDLGGDEVLHY